MAEGLKHEKWIVVTTIQKPTEAMKQLASISDWKVVVVGDRVTPKAWRYNFEEFALLVKL